MSLEGFNHDTDEDLNNGGISKNNSKISGGNDGYKLEGLDYDTTENISNGETLIKNSKVPGGNDEYKLKGIYYDTGEDPSIQEEAKRKFLKIKKFFEGNNYGLNKVVNKYKEMEAFNENNLTILEKCFGGLPDKEKSNHMIDTFEFVRAGYSISEAANYVRDGKKLSDINRESLQNNDTKVIIKAIYENIDNGVNIFDGFYVADDLFIETESLRGKVESNGGKLSFDDLNQESKEDVFRSIEQKFREKINQGIRDYLDNNPNANVNHLASTLFSDKNKNLLDAYISYLNIQSVQETGKMEIEAEKFKKPDSLPEEVKKNIVEKFKAFADLNCYNVDDVDENELEEQRRHEERIQEENRRRVEAYKKRIRELNNRNTLQSPRNPGLITEQFQPKSTNLNNATGAEIAANAGLGEHLDDYDFNIDKSEYKDQWIKKSAFDVAWNEFIQSHNEIKDIITKRGMNRIFDVDSGTINLGARELFKNNPILKGMSTEEVNKIYNTLSTFSSNFTRAISNLSNNSSKGKLKVDRTVKTYAIGAVIDNIRDTFDTISDKQNGSFKGFELNNKEPVKKVGNDIIISGSFNGSDIKVRYDLNTGEIFINSFLHTLSDGNKFRVGDNSLIDHPVGKIKAFNDILNEDYKISPLPVEKSRPNMNLHNNKKPIPPKTEGAVNKIGDTPSLHPRGPGNIHIPGEKIPNLASKKQEAQELLNSQVNLIGDTIINETHKQTAKNSAIMGLMKTFNIIRTSNSENVKSIDINNDSNLFRFIQIVENTAEDGENGAQILRYFTNNFMPLIMEYSGLKWNENTEEQNKRNQKSKETFDKNNTNKNIKYLKSKVDNFNPRQFYGVGNFDSSHQLKFIELIEEKLLNKSKSELSISEMENFIKSLSQKENNGETDNEDIDATLEEQLKHI